QPQVFGIIVVIVEERRVRLGVVVGEQGTPMSTDKLANELERIRPLLRIESSVIDSGDEGGQSRSINRAIHNFILFHSSFIPALTVSDRSACRPAITPRANLVSGVIPLSLPPNPPPFGGSVHEPSVHD